MPHVHEVNDGEDTIRWLATQPWWGDGSVGMWGGSYLVAGCRDRNASSQGNCAGRNERGFLWRAWYSPGGALSLHTVIMWSVAMAVNAARPRLAAVHIRSLKHLTSAVSKFPNMG